MYVYMYTYIVYYIIIVLMGSVSALTVCMYTHTRRSTVDPSSPDTSGPESTVLIIEVSSFQGLKMYCSLL